MKQQLSWILLNYFRLLARLQLKKLKLLNPKLVIVGITGSAGKTSCLHACHAILKTDFKVKTNSGSNSESGIPLDILGIKVTSYSPLDWLKYILLAPLMLLLNWRSYDIYLVEMGIDGPNEPKNMSYLLKIVKPDIGIFLNVSPVHLQNFSFLDDIAREKAKLVNSARTAIINPLDPLVKKFTQNKNLIPLKPVSLQIPDYILPPIYAVTFGAAFELAKIFGLTSVQAKNNLISNFHLPPGRSTLLKGINNSTIIDSSYNSSPLAASEMLNLLNTFSSPKIAVLGDMRELGQSTGKEHQKIFKTASKYCNIIISVGPETQKYFGLKAKKFLYWWQASDYLKSNIPPHSTILVKGSQNTIYLEELIKPILQNPADTVLLCRQSPYWQKLKNKFRFSATLSTV